MYIKLREDNFVTINGYKIFELTKPFRFYFDRRKNPTIPYSRLLFSPNDTFNSNQVIRYSVKINDNMIARLYSRFANDLKCHSVYITEKHPTRKMGGFMLFKSKALLSLVNKFDCSSDNDDINTISNYFLKLIKIIFRSYDFDIIYTDYPGIYKICKDEIKTELINFELNKTHIDNTSKTGIILNNMIKNNYEIPLNLLDGNALLKIKMSNISGIKNFEKKCMFITISNNFFAGFFRKIVLSNNATNEILPITLFSI